MILALYTDRPPLLRDAIPQPELQETQEIPQWRICEDRSLPSLISVDLHRQPPWPEKRTGTRTYTATVVKKVRCSEIKTELHLGYVREIARVFVNGKDLGVTLWRPYRYDITGNLHDGENTITIMVTNSMANTYEENPIKSGLFGPVRILYYR